MGGGIAIFDAYSVLVYLWRDIYPFIAYFPVLIFYIFIKGLYAYSDPCRWAVFY
jgi:hypothetical protein